VSLRAKVTTLVLASIIFPAIIARGQDATASNPSSQQVRPRKLHVALYPFIPGFEAAAEYVKTRYEAENPDVTLDIIDLRSNYYDSTSDNYIGNAHADVFELDSVLLRDFVADGKIQEMPAGVLLPPDQLLSNADRGTRLENKRYGAAHWVCRNFLFYSTDDPPQKTIKTLADLEAFAGPAGLIIDLRGKSTLGEYYLMAALDRNPDWSKVYPDKIATIDTAIEGDILALKKYCDTASCRNKVLHDYTGTHGAEFARKRGKALVGYSEILHDVLAEIPNCSSTDPCLSAEKLAVTELPLDDNGSRPMSWVDSFTLSTGCTGTCVDDATRFIGMMNRDDTYMALLLPGSLSFLNVQTPGPRVPAYLLPAKVSLYTNATLTNAAPLYKALKPMVENADVPTDRHLNDDLRIIGKQIDKDLDKNVP
jgi:thiamine pyridinylase